MKIGDIVIPTRESGYQLACGSGKYTHAIVTQVNPLILVSEHGDMLWSTTIKPEYFIVLCEAHPRITQKCLGRLIEHKRAEISH